MYTGFCAMYICTQASGLASFDRTASSKFNMRQESVAVIFQIKISELDIEVPMSSERPNGHRKTSRPAPRVSEGALERRDPSPRTPGDLGR